MNFLPVGAMLQYALVLEPAEHRAHRAVAHRIL
jgi:hypothetical protein